MANQEHLDLLKQGVETWNRWRKEHPSIQPDLSHIDFIWAYFNSTYLNESTLMTYGIEGYAPPIRVKLCEANLSGASLRRAELRGAELIRSNFSGTDLWGANLVGADLFGANLNKACLSRAHLNKADLAATNLAGADLSEADLNRANLSGTNLRGTNLSGARVGGTIFGNIDLREVKGLAELHHEGPSHIALATVQLPQDGSAFHFLRGAGIPDEWIDFWRTTMMHSIQYHSSFICYSNKDETLARRLHADLQDHGVRCWFAPEDMKIGDQIRARIDEAIHLQDKLLLLLSEYSIASTWVENEVEAALEKEDRQQREVLFPVRLDESVMQTSRAWAATLRRTRHIGDFTNWTDPQAYQQAFERLLRDLKKADEQQDQEMKR